MSTHRYMSLFPMVCQFLECAHTGLASQEDSVWGKETDPWPRSFSGFCSRSGPPLRCIPSFPLAHATATHLDGHTGNSTCGTTLCLAGGVQELY